MQVDVAVRRQQRSLPVRLPPEQADRAAALRLRARAGGGGAPGAQSRPQGSDAPSAPLHSVQRKTHLGLLPHGASLNPSKSF